MRESDLLKTISHYLTLRGHLFKRNQSGFVFINDAKYGKRAINMGGVGWPDFIGMVKGKGQFFGIEAKVEGRKPTLNQIAILKQIEENGGLSVLAYSLDDVQKAGL